MRPLCRLHFFNKLYDKHVSEEQYEYAEDV